MSNQPIGVFDSGFGGLSVFKELVKQLPAESLIYYGDNANCPYGSKPTEQVVQLSVSCTEKLLALGCKLIVVACNTATAAAIETLREQFSVPFVGIEPAIKLAADTTKTGTVGVLATENTLKSDKYRETSERFAKGVQVLVQPGYGLVELVEKGEHLGQQARELLQKYVQPMLAANADRLVLGCTHYPFLIPVINELGEGKLQPIDPAPAVARQTSRLLEKHQLAADPAHVAVYQYLSSGSAPFPESLMDGLPKENTYADGN